MSDPDRDLEATAAELADAVRQLRDELRPTPRRGPLGLPRPPDARRMLRFADEVAIPATIAVLEANVKLLEALGRGVRMARTDVESDASEARIDAAARETLGYLDDAVAELRDAIEGRDAGDDLDRLLAEIDRLRTEIDDRLAEAEAGATSDTGAAATDRNAGTEIPVDVDAELESLRDEYGEDGDESAGDDRGSEGAR